MDTRTHILDVGEALMKRTGYSGFSYAEVAAEVGIRKASIHYHFPSKADLARAAVVRYRQRLSEALGDADPARGPADAVRTLGAVFEQAFAGPGNGCLCGSLAADWAGLPEPVRAEIKGYWADATGWIRAALAEDDPARADSKARLIFALFEGALISAKVEGDPSTLKAAVGAAIALAGSG